MQTLGWDLFQMYFHCDSSVSFLSCRAKVETSLAGIRKAFKNQRFDSLISHSRSLRPFRSMSRLPQSLHSRLRRASLGMTKSLILWVFIGEISHSALWPHKSEQRLRHSRRAWRFPL